jgi:hypothetical protein
MAGMQRVVTLLGLLLRLANLFSSYLKVFQRGQQNLGKIDSFLEVLGLLGLLVLLGLLGLGLLGLLRLLGLLGLLGLGLLGFLGLLGLSFCNAE